jgi:hypothetical protein
MSDNLVYFDLQAIVAQILGIFISKMAKKGSKWPQKRVVYAKMAKTYIQKYLILVNMG